jgi:hypothetical protein
MVRKPILSSSRQLSAKNTMIKSLSRRRRTAMVKRKTTTKIMRKTMRAKEKKQ